MELNDLLEAIKQMPLLELQEKQGSFLGAVLANSELRSIEDILNTFFGQPLKPVDVEASEEVAKISQPYGGIRKEQTLYYQKGNQGSTLAMIWPWSDRRRLTLKVIHQIV